MLRMALFYVVFFPLAPNPANIPSIVIEDDPSATPLASLSHPAVESRMIPTSQLAAPAERIEQKDVLKKLEVQAALREGRGLLAAGRFPEAVQRLETSLSDSAGAADYLATLEIAYRNHLARLVTDKKLDQARLIAQRLRALDANAAADIDVDSLLQKPDALTRLAQGATSAVKSLVTRETPPVSVARNTNYQVRARQDVPEAAVTSPAKKESTFDQAEQRFAQGNYAEALALYEKTYETDPVGVQVGRERWGYCLLHMSVERYNQLLSKELGSVSAKEWDRLESDVRLARRLSPNLSFTDTVLAGIVERRREHARRESVASVERTSARGTLDRYHSEPAVEAPARSVRHLPGRSQSWSVAETKNFRIFHRDPALAEEVGRLAEESRKANHEFWFPNEPLHDWSPVCELYLYPTAYEYGQATGVGPQSPGHSKVVNDQGRITSRAVCLRCDDPNMKHAVLPHEITHVVLAGQFGPYSLPRWADEGMAVLTEPRDKQDSHLVNLSRSRGSMRGFTCADVLTMADYPTGGQMLDFYAHSVGLCRYLVDRYGSTKFVAFLRGALERRNYETALREVYAVDFNSLESEFNRYVSGLGQPSGPQTAQR